MRKVPKHLAKEIAALKRLKDKDIDVSDIPEITDVSRFAVGQFYRPIKKPVTIRLDADLIAWLRKQGPGYQTRVNHILREAMIGSVRRSA
jgi:uncharacterized protein (DUF4415 family)